MHKKGSWELKEVEDNPFLIEEQRQLHRDRLDELRTEWQARLKILS